MDYKNVNDYEVLYMVAEDSDESMELLLDKYRPLIKKQTHKWSAVLRKLGLEIEDLEQEIYCAIFLAIRNYDDTSSATLYTYLVNVIERNLLYIIRGASSKKRLLSNQAVSLSTPVGDDGAILEDFLLDPDAYIEPIVEEKVLREAIYDFCYELTVDKAFIFELYLNGFDIVQIANLSDFTSAQISNMLSKLRKRVKKYLIKSGELNYNCGVR